MKDKIIKLKKLPSGTTAIALETETGLALEVGSGCIFLGVDDLYAFIRLMGEADRFFLKRCPDK